MNSAGATSTAASTTDSPSELPFPHQLVGWPLKSKRIAKTDGSAATCQRRTATHTTSAPTNSAMIAGLVGSRGNPRASSVTVLCDIGVSFSRCERAGTTDGATAGSRPRPPARPQPVECPVERPVASFRAAFPLGALRIRLPERLYTGAAGGLARHRGVRPSSR